MFAISQFISWPCWSYFPHFFAPWKQRKVSFHPPAPDRTEDLGAPPNILVLYSNHNKGTKHDATGAFIPEAQAFKEHYDVPDTHFCGIDLVALPKAARRSEVYRAIHDATYGAPLDMIAFFGHGWPAGIQFGFAHEHISELGAILARKCAPSVKVILYACLTAENSVADQDHDHLGPGTDGGFADELRDEMVRHGLHSGWVDAHKTRGHTSWNPYVVRFYCESTADADYDGWGGTWLVAPRSEFWRRWCKGLRSNSDNIRYRFPTMSELELKTWLSGL